jgi:NADH-quinone oxidoreductase subunit D
VSTRRTIEVDLGTSGLNAQGQPIRAPLTVQGSGAVALETMPGREPELESDHMLINIGPQHPATHGVLRLVLELDGETVVRCIPHIGYLHCGFEKMGEYRQYNQIIPWTDREDYLNSPGNNVAFSLAAERLFGVECTPRATVLRVILMELSRIMSHVVWLGTTSVDIGAFTPFLWLYQERENIYNLLEGWVGARLTTSATRVGGMAADIPNGWLEGLRAFLKGFPKTLEESVGCSRPTAFGLVARGPWRDERAGSGECRPIGSDAARVRRRVRRAKRLPVSRLRDVRLRRGRRYHG